MKELYNAGNGALVLSEEGGEFVLSVNAQAAVGGGLAAGILELEGSGKVKLKGKVAFDLGMKLLEAHSPAFLVPAEEAAQALGDKLIDQQ